MTPQDDGIIARTQAAVSTRQIRKEREILEAEAAKPLQSRRTNSPAEAKREMERARAEIESTLGMMTRRAVSEARDLKRRVDLPGRLRDRVRTDPWGTLAIAAGVGIGMALLGAGGKRGYEALTEDEIEEIRAWRKERRRHLQRLEILMERSASANARPSFRQRVRARLAAGRDEDD